MGRELYSTQLASGAVGCAQVVSAAGVAGPPGQLTSVMLSAQVRAGLEEYVRAHGGTLRDVVQATLVAFLVDRGVMDDPRAVERAVKKTSGRSKSTSGKAAKKGTRASPRAATRRTAGVSSSRSRRS